MFRSSIFELCKDNAKWHGNYYSMLGLCRGYGKQNGNYYRILEFVGIEKKMETTILYGSYVGVREKRMETMVSQMSG